MQEGIGQGVGQHIGGLQIAEQDGLGEHIFINIFHFYRILLLH